MTAQPLTVRQLFHLAVDSHIEDDQVAAGILGNMIVGTRIEWSKTLIHVSDTETMTASAFITGLGDSTPITSTLAAFIKQLVDDLDITDSINHFDEIPERFIDADLDRGAFKR